METPPTGNDMAFNHGILCQVGLPRAKVDGSHFLRQSGDAWMSVQAGLLDEGKGPVQQPVPYGALPRLALAWVSTYAVRHKTAESAYRHACPSVASLPSPCRFASAWTMWAASGPLRSITGALRPTLPTPPPEPENGSYACFWTFWRHPLAVEPRTGHGSG